MKKMVFVVYVLGYYSLRKSPLIPPVKIHGTVSLYESVERLFIPL
jgi:hypothetical protein